MKKTTFKDYSKFESRSNGTYYIGNQAMYTFSKVNMNSILFKYLSTILANPGITRKELQKIIYPEKKCLYSSYSGHIWRNMLANDLIYKYKVNKSYVYYICDNGKNLIEEMIIRSFKIK